MSQRTSWLFGFAWRFAVALALCGLGFWCLVSPRAVALLGLPLDSTLARVLDAPVSGLNLVLPGPLRSGFARQFGGGSYSFPRSLSYEAARYLAVGVPAYLALLYLPSAVIWFRRRSTEIPHGA